MSFTQNPIATFYKQPRGWLAKITNGDAQALKSIVPGGLNGSGCTGIVAASTDTSDRDVQLILNVGGTNSSGTITGGTNYILGTIKVSAGSGNTSAVFSVAMLDPNILLGLPRSSDGNPYFPVETLNFLCVSAPVTVTSGKEIDFFGIGGDF